MDDVIIDDGSGSVPFDMAIGTVRRLPCGRGRRLAPPRPSPAGRRMLAMLPAADAALGGHAHRTMLGLARMGLAVRVDGVWTAA